jgi:TP901-1 family phage major tail protein
MAAQKGKSVLIKLGDGGSPTEAFTTIGGLRSSSITLNDETVDITNKDSSGVRELLGGAGVNSVTISGSGVFTDSATEVSTRALLGASSFSNFQFIVPALGTYEGAFMLASLEYAGEYNGETTYSMTFESSGAVTFS